MPSVEPALYINEYHLKLPYGLCTNSKFCLHTWEVLLVLSKPEWNHIKLLIKPTNVWKLNRAPLACGKNLKITFENLYTDNIVQPIRN